MWLVSAEPYKKVTKTLPSPGLNATLPRTNFVAIYQAIELTNADMAFEESLAHWAIKTKMNEGDNDFA